MDQASILRGTGVFAYLVILAVLLFVILIRRGVPRRAALEAVEISAGIFVFALVVTFKIAKRLVPDDGDSLLIYIPPVIPAAAFALWLLRRWKKKRNEAS